MGSEDPTGLPSRADFEALVERVERMRTEHTVLAGDVDVLVDIARDLISIQSELTASIEQLHADIARLAQAFASPGMVDPDDPLGERDQAAELPHRPGVLVRQAGDLRAEARRH
jgi:hypothetical protein